MSEVERWEKLPKRFRNKVARVAGDKCWIWTGGKRPSGYGQFFFNGSARQAHRVAYELLIAPIPEGMQIDHICRVPACVNPDHMQVVSMKENKRRGINPGQETARKAKAKTHCPNGHPYNSENTYHSAEGYKKCRACARESYRAKSGLQGSGERRVSNAMIANAAAKWEPYLEVGDISQESTATTTARMYALSIVKDISQGKGPGDAE